MHKNSCLEVQLWYNRRDVTWKRPALKFDPTLLIRLDTYSPINGVPLHI